jgi:2-polyprenyl-3-methyl-5-hydroxy-6-metoxy-1,4-benzoquinol methylase
MLAKRRTAAASALRGKSRYDFAMDDFTKFKEAQKQGWVHFAPLETWTIPSAAQLVRHAGIRSGQRVLDVACGTGPVAITAARAGAMVKAIDLTPQLLERARENAALAGVTVDFGEADVEHLPFGDAEFDVVVSQYGHMFAPRPDVAISEMLRVLKPGGTIAFSTWPPELLVGKTFMLVGRYAPPPPPGAAPPPLWGDPKVVSERLGAAAVSNIVFDRQRMLVPALSPAHARSLFERTAGPAIKVVEMLSKSDPAKLEAFRREYESLVAQYYEDNLIRQDYLMTRGTKQV